jgi:hypothetical protein
LTLGNIESPHDAFRIVLRVDSGIESRIASVVVSLIDPREVWGVAYLTPSISNHLMMPWADDRRKVPSRMRNPFMAKSYKFQNRKTENLRLGMDEWVGPSA